MPRAKRKKAPAVFYHVMNRSISEISLFRSRDDKCKYLELLSQYCKKFECSVISYCLMDTHLHLQLDPKGADLSKFMHGLNLSYALYYNKKYKRHGHVFQGRFLSKMITTDEYNLTVSAYIHSNPKDIPRFSDHIQDYYFSSLGIYLGLFSDNYKLIDTKMILSYFSDNTIIARAKYAEFIAGYNKNIDKVQLLSIAEQFKDNFEYRSVKTFIKRNYKPEEVLKAAGDILNINVTEFVRLKYNKKMSDYRALSVFLLRALCDYTYIQICEIVGVLSVSGTAKLCSKGYSLLQKRLDSASLLAPIIQLINRKAAA